MAEKVYTYELTLKRNWDSHWFSINVSNIQSLGIIPCWVRSNKCNHCSGARF